MGCMSGLHLDEMLRGGADVTESRVGRQYQGGRVGGAAARILLGRGRRRPRRRAQKHSAAAQGQAAALEAL